MCILPRRQACGRCAGGIHSYICAMNELIQQIEGYRQEIEQLQVEDSKSLEDYRIRFLGSKGIVKNLFGELRNIPNEQKKDFGLVLNEFRQFAESKYEEWKQNTNGKQEESA